jgi:hypothetical protein
MNKSEYTSRRKNSNGDTADFELQRNNSKFNSINLNQVVQKSSLQRDACRDVEHSTEL